MDIDYYLAVFFCKCQDELEEEEKIHRDMLLHYKQGSKVPKKQVHWLQANQML